MRKLFISLILMAFGLSAFAQPQTKYAHFIPSYPPVVGESTCNNYVFNHNGLYLHDVILDSLPHYEIEHIPNQTVRFLEDGIGFYVKADSLHSNNVVYSYEVDVLPIGPFEFNANTGRFKFYPNTGDYMPFTVTFTATSGENSLTQAVEFDIMPEVMPEESVIQSLGTMPSAQEYTIITETHWDTTLNNLNRTVYSYSISGKEIVLDDLFPNTNILYNMYELNLFAERLYIRSALAFPHTNVNIYARELVFEDNGSEIASINTTPLAIGTETNVTGMNGENAGNITLYVNKLTANYAKRFILNGAKGQNANFNGTPGNGGNGGVLSAPINIEGYGDFARGSAGVKYDTLNLVIGAGQAGVNGHFELITDRYSWVHPYYIAAVIRHLNDAYLNDYFSYTLTTANVYYNLISEFEASDEWESFDGTLKVELQDQRTELEGMLYKLNEGLDYFGNPVGWTPLLSFEVYKDLFNDEIDRSMPTLYLNYWLHNIDQSLANKIEAARVAADQTQNDIVATRDSINALTENIPRLEGKITEVLSQLEESQTRLNQLQAELTRKAKHNVKKKNRLNKAFGIATGVLNCIPGYGQIASAALTIGGSFFGITDTYGYSGALSSTFQSVLGFNYGQAMDNVNSTISSIDMSNLGQAGNKLKDSYQYFDNIIKPLSNSVASLQQAFAKSSAPGGKVEEELKKLCAQSVEFQKLEKEIAVLQQSKTELDAARKQTFVDMLTLTSEVSNEMVTLDALRGDVFQGNSRRDLQAMQCVEKMKQRAMNRLVKYHYYMRKAYEYRLVRPYQGDFSLETMYNRIENLINQGDIIFNDSTPVNYTNYSVLSAMFREEVSNIIEGVVEELTHNSYEVSTSISITVSREVLDVINANDKYNLNLFELGLLSPSEENVRITGFDVQYMEAHTEGNTGMSTYMDIELVHSGISRFRKNGEVYWFNHVSKSTESSHPNTWRIRYNPTTQETTAIGPSLATQSLLYSLLEGNVQNIMLFSRPAAWSDIFMSKKVHTSGNADIVIDSLVLSLQYDFTPRPDAIRNIDIATSDGLLPYIACSEADRNGRSSGKGTFHRSYTRSSGTVTFTAMDTYGNYHFLNWSDRVGTVVTESNELTVSKSTDQFYRANYELWIPVLNVADTIYVGNGDGEYVVQIQNVGLGNIEMDWYVSDSLSTWVHVNGIAEGVDDGSFTFTYEANAGGEMRIDSLEILAPEIEGMSKTVYIVQYSENHQEISASVNPEGAGMVLGTGFYEQGSICTLTATANEGYTFINWMENGEVVSTEATYAFTVTGNRTLVANFIYDYHWDVNIYDYSSTMTIIGIIQIDGVEQMVNTLEIGAFCGNECRGREQLTDQYYSAFGHCFVFLTVYGYDGNTISFRLYDHTIGKELDLVCASITFVTNATYGNVTNPYVFDFGSNGLIQTTNFAQGWNWWSTYVEADNLFDQLKAGLGANATQIKSSTTFVNYFNGMWIGGLSSISNESCYLIKANNACTLEMTGMQAMPANHPITINPNWNWIGYPNSGTQSVGNAFSNFTPTNGDQVKSQNAFSSYYNGMWVGGLNTITPGMGLLYKSNNTSAMTLIYHEANRSKELVENVTNESKHWTADYHAYPSNMTVMAVVELDDKELSGEQYEIAASANGECRGNVRLMYVEPINRYIAFLTIVGDEAAELRFSLYDSETGSVETQDFASLQYETNATIGSLEMPYVIRFRSATGVDEWANNVNIFPNPVNRGERFSLGMTEETGMVQVEIVNALGVVVETQNFASPQSITAPNVAGVYTLRINIKDKETYYRKLMVR